jgi:hypothetical protein
MWDTCKGWWEGKIKVEVDECVDGRARFPGDPFAAACQHGRADQPI